MSCELVGAWICQGLHIFGENYICVTELFYFRSLLPHSISIANSMSEGRIQLTKEDEQNLSEELVEIRLSTLEHLTRDSCANFQSLSKRLQNVEQRIERLHPQCSARVSSSEAAQRDDALGSFGNQKERGDLCHASTPQSSIPLSHFCDYCFVQSANCFPCPLCGREWYCSEACRRLRRHRHDPHCRGA